VDRLGVFYRMWFIMVFTFAYFEHAMNALACLERFCRISYVSFEYLRITEAKMWDLGAYDL